MTVTKLAHVLLSSVLNNEILNLYLIQRSSILIVIYLICSEENAYEIFPLQIEFYQHPKVVFFLIKYFIAYTLTLDLLSLLLWKFSLLIRKMSNQCEKPWLNVFGLNWCHDQDWFTFSYSKHLTMISWWCNDQKL